MLNLVPTDKLVENLTYYGNSSDFFSNFPNAWKKVEKQVLKLETRQVYREPGNISFDSLEKGDFDEAVKLISEARKGDVELYQSLASRHILLERCRPIEIPLSDYLKWEVECYKFNSKHGENIYVSKKNELYEQYAMHDFMVFDDKIAFIHDYDDKGEIRGGWMTTDKNIIANLTNLFLLIKERSTEYSISDLLTVL
jgi:hypothetical protein